MVQYCFSQIHCGPNMEVSLSNTYNGMRHSHVSSKSLERMHLSMNIVYYSHSTFTQQIFIEHLLCTRPWGQDGSHPWSCQDPVRSASTSGPLHAHFLCLRYFSPVIRTADSFTSLKSLFKYHVLRPFLLTLSEMQFPLKIS